MFLGLDISKLNFDAAFLEGPDARPRHKAFPNTAAGFERLQEWIGADQVYACLEATGTYGDALARSLHARGHTVSVVNPARIKAFGQSQMSRAKTDKADAALIARFCALIARFCALIARFCALHRPEAWTPPASEMSELQAWVRRLESLHEMRQMENNRLKAGPAASVQVEGGSGGLCSGLFRGTYRFSGRRDSENRATHPRPHQPEPQPQRATGSAGLDPRHR